MNIVCLVGRLTKDPELRIVGGSNRVVQFSLAVQRDYVDQIGNRGVDFINCIAWNTQADFLSKYLKKGHLLSVEGRIQTRQYQDQQKQTRYITEVAVARISSLQSLNQTQNQMQTQGQAMNNMPPLGNDDFPF